VLSHHLCFERTSLAENGSMKKTRYCLVCGAANELAHTHYFACGHLLITSREGQEEPDKGLLQERYQLGPILGSGGFSAVYQARDLQSEDLSAHV
jgi:hypothetical protein